MSFSNNAIPGEAPESDSEEEINTIVEETRKVVSSPSVAAVTTTITQTPHGRIVAGEAPESDEEICDSGSVGSVSSAASVSSIASLTSGLRRAASSSKISSKQHREEAKYKSLLHRKLRERNASLWRNVSDLVHITCSQATRDLNLADQQLLKSQGVLQETAVQVRAVGANLEMLRDKLSMLTATPYLPHVSLPASPALVL